MVSLLPGYFRNKFEKDEQLCSESSLLKVHLPAADNTRTSGTREAKLAHAMKSTPQRTDIVASPPKLTKRAKHPFLRHPGDAVTLKAHITTRKRLLITY